MSDHQQCPECGALIQWRDATGELVVAAHFCNGAGSKDLKFSATSYDFDNSRKAEASKPVASEAVERIAALVSRKRMKAATDGCVVFSWQEMRRLDDHVAECAAKDARIAELESTTILRDQIDSLMAQVSRQSQQLAAAQEALRRIKYEAVSLADAPVIALEAIAAPPADGKEKERG